MYRVISRIFGVSIIVLLQTLTASPQSRPVEGQANASVPIGSAEASPGVDAHQSSNMSSASPILFTRAGADDGLRVGGGDLLLVSVFGASDYAHEVRVAGDGTIVLPLIGQVRVAGLTPREVAADLQTRLANGGYFNNPQVSVFVKEYATQGVSVLGEVQKPGVYPLLGARTLFDLLSAAQGTTQTAGDLVYITHRGQASRPQIIKLTYDGKGVSQSNVPLLPGDTVVVQKAGMVYVVGNVQKPAGIAMVDPGLTVLKAIALAQGIAPNAALDKARLVRKTSDGQEAIPLPLKKMLAAKAPDMKLQPEDIIFVPNSTALSAFKRSLELALQTASGVIIYHQY